jgi:hypothetical protein
MRNGDCLTCEIKGLDSDTLSISLDYAAGTVSINWGEVDHIESKQLFLVKTMDGLVYSGTLATPSTPRARPTKIEVFETPADRVELEQNHIIHMEQTDLSFFRRINGQIGLSLTYNKGNQSAQYNLNGDAAYPRERWSAAVSYSSSLFLQHRQFCGYTQSDSAECSASRAGTTGTTRTLWNSCKSSEQGIQLQSTFGGGIGRYLKNTNNTMISIYSGVAWENIAYHDKVIPASNQQVTSALIVEEMQLFRFDKTNLNLTAIVLPGLSKPGRVHTNLNIAY